MTQFLMWPKTIDVSFRSDYLTETGENIQQFPLESLDLLSYMIGSSRISQTQVDNLKVLHQELITATDSDPIGWIPIP